MVAVKTAQALVESLGDEAAMVQHLDVESDLNELIALTELVSTKLAAWSSATVGDRAQLRSESFLVIERGDRLADESILRRSAVAAEEIELARARWASVRRVLESLPRG